MAMALRGESGWQATHQKAFGKDRWKVLRKALRAPVVHVALVNRFLSLEAQARARVEHKLRDHEGLPLACSFIDGAPVAGVAAGEEGDDGLLPGDVGEKLAEASADPGKPVIPDALMSCYFLDGASVLAAQYLGVQPGDNVLDLCAAPGGKSLCLASFLFAPARGNVNASGSTAAMPEESSEAALMPPRLKEGGRLVCNDSSNGRAARLRRVLGAFLPEELTAAGGRVTVTNVDATASTSPPAIQRLGPYDKILVDAPCSSDRHLAHQGEVAFTKWATGSVKGNADRQFELLRGASLLLKKGGVLLYVTCALSPLENDGVVAKFLRRAGDGFEADGEGAEGEGVEGLPGVERTEFGIMVLPDTTPYGPMYIARLRKL